MNQAHDNPLLLLAIVFGAILAYYFIQAARRKREVKQFQLLRVGIYITCVMIGVGILPSYGYSIRDAALFSFFVGMSAALILIKSPYSCRPSSEQG
jgi:hypothetical protein